MPAALKTVRAGSQRDDVEARVQQARIRHDAAIDSERAAWEKFERTHQHRHEQEWNAAWVWRDATYLSLQRATAALRRLA